METVPVSLEIREPFRGKIAQLLQTKRSIDDAIGVLMECLVKEAGYPMNGKPFSLSQDATKILGEVPKPPEPPAGETQ